MKRVFGAVSACAISGLMFVMTACPGAQTPKPVPQQAKDDARFCAQYIQQQKLVEAEKRCNQAKEIAPFYAVPYNFLGIIERERGRSQRAVDFFQMAIQRDAKFAEAYNNLGGEYFGLKKYAQAVEAFKTAVRIDPSYTDAHRNLATAYLYDNNAQQARKTFEKCLELSPNDCECFLGLGQVAQDGKEYDKARSHYKRMTQICPNDARGFYHLGIVEHKTTRCRQAVTAFMSALALDKELLDTRHRLVEAYECVAMNNPTIKRYIEEVKKNPGYPEGHYQLGLAFAQQNIYEQALTEFLNTIKLDKQHPLAHYQAARIFDHLLRKDETISYCKKFIALLKSGQQHKEKAWCTQRVKALEFE